MQAISSSTGQYASRTTSSAYRGAYFQGHTNWYDAYFDGNVGIFVNGFCTGCTMAYIVQNNGFEAIEPGDLVAVTGIATPLVDGQAPVMTVSKVTADNQHALVGVVSTRYEVIIKTEPIVEVQHVENEVLDGLTDQMVTVMEKEEVIVGERLVESGHITEGAVMPGDYMLIVHDGLTQVRLSADVTAIQVGDELVAAPGGHALTIEDAARLDVSTQRVIGIALEVQPDNQRLIWVLVKLR